MFNVCYIGKYYDYCKTKCVTQRLRRDCALLPLLQKRVEDYYISFSRKMAVQKILTMKSAKLAANLTVKSFRLIW